MNTLTFLYSLIVHDQQIITLNVLVCNNKRETEVDSQTAILLCQRLIKLSSPDC